MANVLNASDAIYGSLAECYVTIDGNRYNMMQLHEFDSSFEVNIKEVPLLGTTQKGHKACGGKGSWSGKAYFTQSVFRKWMLNYKNTGVLAPFDIQIINNDPASAAGRQSIILRNCLLDKVTLAKFTAGDDLLDEDLSGTYDDWDMPESFNTLSGMNA